MIVSRSWCGLEASLLVLVVVLFVACVRLVTFPFSLGFKGAVSNKVLPGVGLFSGMDAGLSVSP